jgi:hypothetical protein
LADESVRARFRLRDGGRELSFSFCVLIQSARDKPARLTDEQAVFTTAP